MIITYWNCQPARRGEAFPYQEAEPVGWKLFYKFPTPVHFHIYRVIFLLVPPQKVLSIEDGKIPTKKVKVDLSPSKIWSFNSDFHFFGRDFAILNT